IVVHCSAGIGRTGTFIALDSLLKEAAAMDSIDVINCVSKLRQQRAFSIQTDMQYAFLHDAIVHAVTHHNLLLSPFVEKFRTRPYFKLDRNFILSIEYSSLSQSSFPGNISPVRREDYAAQAVDGDPFTFIQTKNGTNNYWRITFDRPTSISCFTMFVSGGVYKISVNLSYPHSQEKLCDEIPAESVQNIYKIKVCCDRELQVDSFTITRTDVGVLQLNEIYLKGCCKGFYGFSCMECNESCSTCDAANGECLSCAPFRFGARCEKTCPYKCLNGFCDRDTGFCTSCYPGASGQKCTPCKGGKYGHHCNQSCTDHCDSDCEAETGKCIASRSLDKNGEVFDQKNISMAVVVFLVLNIVIIIALVERKAILRICMTKKYDSCETYRVIELEEIRQDDSNEYEEICQHEYVNTLDLKVSVDKFVEKVRSKKVNFVKEFKEIPCVMTDAHLNALLPENRRKNRYKKIYPNDCCRVILDLCDVTGNSDYINASFINGFEKERKYIAAQGPFNHETTVLFWEMIWQYNISRVLMLTKLMEGDGMQCVQYWPLAEERIGRVKITPQGCRIMECITTRTFLLERDDESRTLKHYQFTGWLKNKVPSNVNTIIQFHNLARFEEDEESGPILIHCSAGIGRTGTYLAFDYLMEEANKRGTVDVINCIGKLRQQRPFMVQTSEEYRFLHEALSENLTHMYVDVIS
ncbi:receptor-type tyrosine-protein phosphatase C-like, partial [Saccostrea cucullata]|uniref:receptor-type tyrosine-protein phosphatase C-like n=1 Tax=Saccostrea cuccullata TaxID=36930 RepID=UPI002ED203A3